MGRHIELIARGVIIEDGRVLLCRSVSGGHSYLPGGHIEHGESAEAALVREFEEEAGVAIRAGAICLVAEVAFESGGKSVHEINLVFHGEREAVGEVRSREPAIEFHWANLDDLTAIDLRPLIIRDWLRDRKTLHLQQFE